MTPAPDGCKVPEVDMALSATAEGSADVPVPAGLLALTGQTVWTTDAQGRFITPPAPDLAGGTRLDDLCDTHRSRTILDRIRTCVAAHRPFRDMDVALRQADGGARWLRLSGLPRYAPDGGFSGYQGIAQDITADRLTQTRQVTERSLAGIAQFSMSVAHELNNILTSISLYTISGSRATEGQSELRHLFEQCKAATELGRRTLSDITTFAVGDCPPARACDLGREARAVLDMHLGILRRDILARVVITETPLPVLARPTEIAQVLTNLIQNAERALPAGPDGDIDHHEACSGPTLHITIDTIRLTATDSVRYGQPPGTYALLEVRDSGVGMEPEVKARIFDPFFTTHAARSGTGMGLSVVYGLVRTWHGSITVDSALGRGSSFRIIIPLAPADETGNNNPNREET